MGYKIGQQKAVYALEGSIAIAGDLVQWLRDNLGLVSSSAEVETLARSVEDNGGIYVDGGMVFNELLMQFQADVMEKGGFADLRMGGLAEGLTY